ncbi:glycosyltransferase family 4 protein, partial [Candidatus Uhrbacteria bacterium]|nr:glycosyltransferase family 4 protein [Candidatus Uhrbacteria bacterium]
MRIGIDARFFGPRVGGGGLGRYVEELIRHLEKLDAKNEYVIFLRKKNWDDYSPQATNFRKVLAPWRWYTLAEQWGMPRLAQKEKLDLLHVPHFNVPIFLPIPFIVTIHDLILLRFPSIRATRLDPLRFWLKFLAYRLVLAVAVRRSCHIIAVSQATANDLVSYLHVPEEKITVIHSGPTPPSKNYQLPVTGYQLPIPYLLTVGNAYPHKNLDGLLIAFCDILQKNPTLTLISVGPDDAFRAGLKKLARQLGLSDQVQFLGFVDEATLDNLYQKATAYLVPSLLEGFALPGLEAQLRGVPVLASDIPAHREVFETSALYFDPRDHQAIAQTIQFLLDHPEWQKNLREEGLKNCQRFSWSAAAQKTLSLYQHAQ